MRLALAALLVLFAGSALAVEKRSQVEKRRFAKAHPCPATGKRIPSCPGYVIDHIRPLCSGAPDKAANMQWQKQEASYRKDVLERRYCACLKGKTPTACVFKP